MRTVMSLSLLLAGLMLAGCGDLVVPDFNNPSLEDLQTNPTPTGVITATQGLLIGARAGIANQPGYVAHLGILGRESYTFDNSDPRYVDEMVAGQLDPGNGAFGGSGWAPRYANLRNANIVLNALERVAGFSAEERAAIQGFVKTIQAHDYLLIVNMRDTNGGAIDVNRPVDADPAPLVGKAEMLAHVANLLDEARTHLQAAGTTFPFRLSSGFAGFDTPQTFVQFNRALRARVAAYRENYAEALTALQQSFVSTSAPLDLGVYHAFSTGPGDVLNGLFQGTSPVIVAHPSIVADAERKPDGTLDERVQRKTAMLSSPVTSQGVSSNVRFTLYNSLGAPVPIVRNEELILLRAEARWFTNDRTGALQDLNFIRQTSGGLAAIGIPASDAAFITELLKQRRYSLLFEGGHRWIDHRRFGRLAELPRARATDDVAPRFPIPAAECLARRQPVPCSA